MIKHIRRWNIWRKDNLNSRFYKFLVLIGVVMSPTMCFTLLPEEWMSIVENIADLDDFCHITKLRHESLIYKNKGE